MWAGGELPVLAEGVLPRESSHSLCNDSEVACGPVVLDRSQEQPRTRVHPLS